MNNEQMKETAATNRKETPLVENRNFTAEAQRAQRKKRIIPGN
jgi:hypothetical protein